MIPEKNIVKSKTTGGVRVMIVRSELNDKISNIQNMGKDIIESLLAICVHQINLYLPFATKKQCP